MKNRQEEGRSAKKYTTMINVSDLLAVQSRSDVSRDEYLRSNNVMGDN